MIALAMLAVLLPALGRRVCDGLIGRRIGWGHRTARILVWCVCCALAALPALLAMNHAWWHALMLVPLMWIGGVVPNFDAIGVGDAGHSLPRDLAMLTLHGFAGVALPVIAAAIAGYAWLALLLPGLLIAPCHAAACAARATTLWRGALAPDRVALGELLWGALVGISLILAILEARPWAL